LLELKELGISIGANEVAGESTSPLQGKSVVITGTLHAFTRDHATELFRRAGAEVTGAVSSRTTLVIAGPSAGKKLTMAQALGIPIVDEDAAISILKRAGVYP